MNNLQFIWKARFVDDTQIQQFNEDMSENRFQQVKDRFKDLRYFYLTHIKLPICFTVDLIKGILFYNNHQQIDIDLKKTKQNIRLIYFRRRKKDFTMDMKFIDETITYFLGLQYNDENNNNHKIVLQIDKDGNFIIGD
jgi:hypothetical protein